MQRADRTELGRGRRKFSGHDWTRLDRSRAVLAQYQYSVCQIASRDITSTTWGLGVDECACGDPLAWAAPVGVTVSR